MNKKLIALAVAAASISSLANAAEVYSDETSSLAVGGRFEARGVLADNDEGNGKVTDATRVRINVAGKTDISDNLYGVGFFEKEFQSADSADDETRYAYAGLGGEYGQVVYGKADGSLGMLTDFTDIMAYNGNEAGNKIAAGDRTSNNLSYVGSFDLSGNNLTVKANYVFDDGQNTDGYSAAAMYAMDMGLAFGAGYGEQDGQHTSQGHQDKTAKQAFGAISYTFGDFYVAGLYQDAENTIVDDAIIDNSRGYELAAAYSWNQTVFTSTYNYLEDTDASGKAKDLRDSLAFDATYYFNKNFRTYASYKFNLLDSDFVGKAAGSDEFVLGARYDF
ncbi:outer membrane protein OmpU [Photobacterium aphoticum]|uniref:Outer membrane protein OmpU n=1 Tax=Photobacterium aphoticum TaxID=754436 RepID=A0A090QT20_9GAMM|nr:outer membrane protein OmpU [Photobacterium aphoticum]